MEEGPPDSHVSPEWYASCVPANQGPANLAARDFARADAFSHFADDFTIDRKRDGNGVATDAADSVGAASASSGSALPTTLMRKFEASLGADLSGVRIHTGGESADSAHAVGAKAYTIGQDIHFGAGHYDPSSVAGEELLAHEVAHTVQQAGGLSRRVQFKLEVSSPGDAHEVEADDAAKAMVEGTPTLVSSSAVALDRKVDPDGKQVDPSAQITALQQEIAKTQGRLKACNHGLIAGKGSAKKAYGDAEKNVEDQYKTFREAYKTVQAALKDAKKGIEAEDEFKKFLVEATLSVVTGGASEGIAAAKHVEEAAGPVAHLAKEVAKEVGVEEVNTIVNDIAGTETTGKEKTELDGDTANPAEAELAAMKKLEQAKDSLDRLDSNAESILDASQTIGQASTHLETMRSQKDSKKDLGKISSSVSATLATIAAQCNSVDSATAAETAKAVFTSNLAGKQKVAATKASLERQIWAAWLRTLSADEFETLRDKEGIVGPLKLYNLYGDFGGNEAERAQRTIGKTAQSYGKAGDGLFRVRVSGTDGTFLAVPEGGGANGIGSIYELGSGSYGTVVGVNSSGHLVVAPNFVAPGESPKTFVEGDQKPPVPVASVSDLPASAFEDKPESAATCNSSTAGKEPLLDPLAVSNLPKSNAPQPKPDPITQWAPTVE